MNDEVGWAGRVMHWLRVIVTLVVANVLFVLGTIAGLVLFGLVPAAIASATLLGRLRAGVVSEHLVRDFVAAYRGQFRRANVIGLPFWIAAVLLFVDVNVLGSLTGPFAAVLTAFTWVIGVTALLVFMAAVTICTRYGDPAGAVLRYAVTLPLVSPIMSIAIVASLAAIGFAFTYFGVLIPLVGASLPLFIATWLIDHRLARFDSHHPHSGDARPLNAGRLARGPSH